MTGDETQQPPLSLLKRNLANLITLARIPLCFASFACALMVIQYEQASAAWGFFGQILLIITSLTDYLDGFVARKFNIVSRIGPLADQVMDKIVYCIIFPTLAVGVMLQDGQEKHHVMLALVLCVTLLVRDHWVNFLRAIADRHNVDSGVKQIGKIRTLCALPTACILYAYCFSRGEYSDILHLNSLLLWIQEPSFTLWVIILELALFVINIVSAISYTRIYGNCLLEELCDGDEVAKRKLLAILPNLLTLMNALMGISAIFLAHNGRYHLSMVLLVFAAIFDKLDGAAARKLGLTEDHVPGRITPGMVFDDIADLISFCIAPAAIAGAYLWHSGYAFWLSLYAILGLVRLIYFTFDKNPIPGFFKGLPSPAAALFVGGIIHASARFDPDCTFMGPWVLGLFLLTGLVMNSYFVHYVHFGKLMSQSRVLTRWVFIVLMVSIFLKDFLGLIALALMGGYFISPLFTKSKPVSPAT
jgi:CDP-diacylglycerol--glycerol-3-phosphate 3-phosphatidyltransferase